MLRILRAFAWLRWRIFMNSLEQTGARDTIERFSLAIERLAPIMLLLVMIPSAMALAGMSAYAGFLVARGDGAPILLEVIRYVILGAAVFCIVGPILLPVADRTNPVRLLLLPISRGTLYLTQITGAIADPWIVLIVPIVIAMPVGLMAGGAAVAGLLTIAAGASIFTILVGISALTTSVLHLLMRDRRRGELIALIVIVILPLVSILPAAFDSAERDARRRARGGEALKEHVERRDAPLPAWLVTTGTRVFATLPSELYTRSIRAAARREIAPAATSVVALVITAVALHSIGLLAFGRVLGSPASSGARRTAAMAGAWGRVLPGVSPGTSAVALAQLRLALRTPRGRSILLSPLLVFIVFAFLMRRSGGMTLGPFAMQSGLGLATFGSFVALMSILPVAMNQFAVDGAGLTMELLSPLRTRELLIGKAIGNALIGIPPALVCVALAALVFPGGTPALWASLVLSLIATAIFVSPPAAIFSSIFPRVVDMNSIGQRSNAHGLSGFLGLIAFVIAALPCLALTLVATKLLGTPMLAPVFLLAWCGLGLGIARLLFIPAETIFDKRRENLATLM